jgi:hypothetical protein
MKTFLYTLIVITLYSCSATRQTATPAEIEALERIANSKTFYIDSDWAYPQLTNALSQALTSRLLQPGDTPSAISLIGNGNFIRIKGDSVTTHLPYYGQRQLQVGFGDRGAIKLNTTIQNLKVKTHKDNSKIFEFSADYESEQIDVFIRIFSNLTTEVVLDSPSRRPIRYSGAVKPLGQTDLNT